jgi:hypothetical protein
MIIQNFYNRNGLARDESDDMSQELFERLLKDEGTRADWPKRRSTTFTSRSDAAAVGYFAPTVNVTGQPGFFCTQTGPRGSIRTTSTGPPTSGAPASIST